MLGLKGNNIFKKDKYRLDYRLYAYTFPTHFWGIGFDKGKRDENDTEYRRIKFDAMMRFLFKIAPRLYMGRWGGHSPMIRATSSSTPIVDFSYNSTKPSRHAFSPTVIASLPLTSRRAPIPESGRAAFWQRNSIPISSTGNRHGA